MSLDSSEPRSRSSASPDRMMHVMQFISTIIFELTYLPHEAVAEVSKDKEPIGRRCGIQLVRFNCFACHLVWDSMDLRFKRFEIQLL